MPFVPQLAASASLIASLLLTTTNLQAAESALTSSLQTSPVHALPDVAPTGSRYPHLTVAGEQVYMSWLQHEDEQASLWFAVLNGDRWSTPKRIASGNNWFVNWADFPSLAVLADGTLVAHWLQKSAPDSYAYDIQLSFSKDHGQHWSAPVRPHDDNTPTEHGFVSLLPQADNHLSVVWLDGRESVHHHERMQLRHASFDANGKKLAEQVIDADTCTCCQTSAISLLQPGAAKAGNAGKPEVLVAYRDHGADEIRDIAVLRLRDGQWSSPQRVHADGWEIPGCPVNGPALAQSAGQAAVLWYTGAQQQPRVQLAFADANLPAGSAGFAPPLRLDRGEPLGRVALVMANPDHAIAGWLERRGERADWLLRSVRRQPNGTDATRYQLGAVVPVADLSIARGSGFPRLALVPSRQSDGPANRQADRRQTTESAQLILAWTDIADGQPPRVRTARVPLDVMP